MDTYDEMDASEVEASAPVLVCWLGDSGSYECAGTTEDQNLWIMHPFLVPCTERPGVLAAARLHLYALDAAGTCQEVA